jgi:acyl-CoA thioester hydrolase
LKSISIRPRFSETDALGHINNTSIAVWFEAGRVEYVDGLLADIQGGIPTLFMATQTLDYIAETIFGVDVRVDAAILKVGTSSFTVGCRMYQSDVLSIRASAVLVFVDKQTRKSVPMPDDMRAMLTAELEPDWL